MIPDLIYDSDRRRFAVPLLLLKHFRNSQNLNFSQGWRFAFPLDSLCRFVRPDRQPFPDPKDDFLTFKVKISIINADHPFNGHFNKGVLKACSYAIRML